MVQEAGVGHWRAAEQLSQAKADRSQQHGKAGERDQYVR